ncbi:hypothetical protein FQV39_20220 [Bosea sp. F3-2]|uniref:pilus assembly protein TadG-related protein n=1 Tax=Bosea sp. F3-2 TaxID=2599640 RepID=UPI0011EF8BE9|nr:pilus assembly protein TadG-related protein [Bosea sp. F3-2]QEL24650.1 hypothetical protein FQV39_20220 [Bosea sp. F3-2]
MRNLLRSRRGSAAFATVVALVPLIGAVALGGEAASWYATKQHAQNAADAAAYSGALKVACANSPTCTETQTFEYRGKQFAAQNGFCGASDTDYPSRTCPTSLPTGTSQSVTIAQLATWKGNSGTYVQATIGQTQPTYLASVLGLSSVSIGATAVARVDSLAKPPCVLALKDPITFQGSPTVSSPSCGIASNSTADNAIGFKGNNGIDLDAPSYTVGGCTQTGGSQCTGVQTYQQPVPDPLSGLDAAMRALQTSDFPNGKCGSTLTSYETGQCYNAGNPTFPSTLSGTYYFTGNVKINGSPTISGTATLIFFGGATLTITGSPTIQLTAVKSPAGPPVLSPIASLMTDLLIYDGEAYSTKGVNISGSSASYFNGTIYVPNTPVTYAGNSGSTGPNPGCYQVIAYAVNFIGNTNLDNSKCISDGAITPNIQTVRLVQ